MSSTLGSFFADTTASVVRGLSNVQASLTVRPTASPAANVAKPASGDVTLIKVELNINL